MTSTNELEKKLLARCYDSNNEIIQILESRYSTEGEQKPTILFKHIDKSNPKKRKNEEIAQSDEIEPQRKRNTRKELKVYINTQLESQRKLIKKIKTLQKENHIFNIDYLIDKYQIPRFESFIKMNEMWQSYIQDLLSTPDGKFQLNTQQILPKLVNADFNGCLLTVLKSRNNNVVGTRGIVVWDCQHSFILVTPRGFENKEWLMDKEPPSPPYETLTREEIVAAKKKELKSLSASQWVGGFKMVPKKYTLFGFDVLIPNKSEDQEQESLQFTILGSRFEIKSIDRSSKKFKNHAVDDIL
ncbi:POP4 [Candida jiufengensis]|uniref:POP4 n=1 Tax=Candida jiufengensis TaxID=497108 RepID=UPI0022258D5D|nr:POP4 [Candida jiufengensis]KAI5956963.1 POP4 [Candida jiufengensis]